MSKHFFMHVNNHANRQSVKGLSSNKKKKIEPSYTVAGILVDNTIKFGISKCSKEDSFSKEVGRNRAIAHAMSQEPIEVPAYILEKGSVGNFFVTRAKRMIK